jgi:lipopolysaccharide/colanic/teichoic acid biosynthesis glycosyltransferase
MIDNPSKNSISVKGDARITALGSRLRKYKLDELPELWNILKGDMSFVGPRPEMKAYTNKLKRDEKLILELRPGLTSPATLKYFREEELLASVANAQEYNDEILWPDKIIINLDYYRNRSFFGDISLIMKTIFRLISKH